MAFVERQGGIASVSWLLITGGLLYFSVQIFQVSMNSKAANVGIHSGSVVGIIGLVLMIL